MRITNLELKNFKRFTDLKILNIPVEAKLVLLIGSNGSGKSSVFDAFEFTNRQFRGMFRDADYFSKNNQIPEVAIEFSDGVHLSCRGNGVQVQPENNEIRSKISKSLIGRSSIRIVPKITNAGNIESAKNNADGPSTFIEVDTRFNNDLAMYMQQIDDALRAPIFSGKSADTLKIFHDYIEPFNTSLINILGGDAITTIQIAEYQNPTPQQNGKLIFRKGDSKINYDLLSHGEKQVVILLLNFIVRREQYQEAVIFIDEMDCHLNTSLQSRLLAEIVNVWIPDNSQLWTASHALGFIDFAKNSKNAELIDLDLLDFDAPQVIVPQPKENMDVYEIALPKETLKNVLAGYKLVVVENLNDQYYNLALNQNGFFFLPAQNSREVFLSVKSDPTKLGLRDRDYLKDSEIAEIQTKYANLKVLKYYAFENYIYHPDNLEELDLAGFEKDIYIKEIKEQKESNLLQIASKIAVARQGYVEFKEGIRNDGDIDPILNALKSNDFEIFYPFFSMKSYYNKAYLSKFRYTPKDLVETKWFKSQMLPILKGAS